MTLKAKILAALDKGDYKVEYGLPGNVSLKKRADGTEYYVIDLSDDDSDLRDYFKNKGARKKYCYGLYQQGKLFNRHLHGNGLESGDWPLIADVFRFMLQNDGPYLIHCRLGRDRAGFVSMLCSALAGATVEDLRNDYMQTYCNYYHIKPHSYEYEIIRMFQADRIIYYIAHPEYGTKNLCRQKSAYGI